MTAAEGLAEFRNEYAQAQPGNSAVPQSGAIKSPPLVEE